MVAASISLSVLLFGAVFVLVSGMSSPGAMLSSKESMKKEREVQMCGHELTRILVVLCNGQFQQMSKRANGKCIPYYILFKSLDDSTLFPHIITRNQHFDRAGHSSPLEQLEDNSRMAYPEESYQEEDAYAPKFFGVRIRRSSDERLRYIYQRGIIEQCCRNSCALDSLMVYCSALVV